MSPLRNWNPNEVRAVTPEKAPLMARNRKIGRIYGAKRSSTGDPPLKQTGRLRASITHEILDDATGPFARVGTNLPYALYLELGTRRMAPRPFLRRALDESRDAIRDLFR